MDEIDKKTDEEKQWYAVYTRSRHEEKVNSVLMQKSIETFLPKIEKWSRRKDRRLKIQVPLFSGYLFVNVGMDRHAWLEIKKIKGVVKILGEKNIDSYLSHPIPIPEEQIYAIRTAIEKKVGIIPFRYLAIGKKVKVVYGPMMGAEGILIRINPKKERLVISVDILQKSVSVEINSEDVEPI